MAGYLPRPILSASTLGGVVSRCLVLGMLLESDGLLRHASFYTRKHATDRIGRPNLTELLYLLGTATHQQGGHVIFVGHSFGARILEKAVGQAFVGQVAAGGSSVVVAPADLTLLINPASEALTARELKFGLRNWTGTANGIPTPAVVTIGSKADSATGVAWPIATSFSALFDTGYRNIQENREHNFVTPEKHYITNTSANSSIVAEKMADTKYARPPPPGSNDDTAAAENAILWNLQHATIDRIRAADSWWGIGQNTDSKSPFLLDGVDSRGYWVIRVPSSILPSHEGIFEKSAIEFVAAVYHICRPDQNKAKRVQITPTLSIPIPESSPLLSR